MLFYGVNSLSAQTKYCTPSYTGVGWNNTGQATSFYTHILEVYFAEISNIVQAPYYNPYPTYSDFSSTINSEVVRGGTYPLSIQLGNGANAQTVAVWIDYNQNKVFETSERIYYKFDQANGNGDHKVSASITIPANAALGSTRMRVGTKLGTSIPDPCTNNTGNDWSQDFQDYSLNILAPDAQYYKSATCFHLNNDEVSLGSTNNIILQIEVNTNADGLLYPQTAGNFDFSVLGSTNPADISSAKLYYGGKDNGFANAKQVGGTITNPSSFFSINANTKLAPGKNYFWLTYDVSANAIQGNLLDAKFKSVFVYSKRIPTVVSPSGNRKIGYCVSKGIKNNFIYVQRVDLGKISNLTYINGNGYGNYTNLSTLLDKGKKHGLSILVGNGVNNSYTQVWIDYNKDGDFADAGERVLFDSITTASQNTPTYGPMKDSITVPTSAVAGTTRMRVMCSYRPGTFPFALPGSCTNPVLIAEIEDYSVEIVDTTQSVAAFTSTSACLGDSTSFIDKSYTYGNYTVTKWHWDFGDGDTSNLQNPYHTFKKAGIYTVTLTVRNNLPGKNSSLRKIVQVSNPVAAYTYSGNMRKTPITFVDETVGGIVTGWQWDFGDPASIGFNNSPLESPVHIFDTAGWYKITLQVYTAGACTDTISKMIYIDSVNKPIADFTANNFNPYNGQTVKLVDRSTNIPTSFKWTFTPSNVTYLNGTSDTSQNPYLSFNLITAYKATLKAINARGSDTTSRFFNVKAYNKPVVDFKANKDTVKAGQLVSFLDLSKNDPTSWYWQFGNKDTSTQQYPIYQYPSTGVYDVQLNIANPAGKDSAIKYNYITVIDRYHLCETDATFSPLFRGKITDSGDSTGKYKGSSTCGFLIQPPCSGPVSLTFKSFNYKNGDYLQIYDGTDVNGIPMFSGLGFTGTTKPPVLIAKSGAMFIREFTNMFGDTTGFVAEWNAVPNVKPKASFITQEINDTIAFTGSPTRYKAVVKNGTNNTYKWDYDGDGILDDTTYSGYNQFRLIKGCWYDASEGYFIYTKPGIYKVKMIASNCKGLDTIIEVINVMDPQAQPTPLFSMSRDTIDTYSPITGNYDTLTFRDHSVNGPQHWKWSYSPTSAFFNYGTKDTFQQPILMPYAPGFYDVTLTVSNSKGSNASTLKKAFYVRDRAQMCNSSGSQFPAGKLSDWGGPIYPYYTNENCGFLITSCGASITLKFSSFDFGKNDYLKVYDGPNNKGKLLFNGSGYGQAPTLTAKSGTMYIEEITDAVNDQNQGFTAEWFTTPFAKPTALFISPDTAYTGGNPAIFTNKSTGKITNYYWDINGDGFDDFITPNVSMKYISAGSYPIRLIVSNCNNSDTFYRTIVILNPTQKPTADFKTDFVIASTQDVIHFTDLTKNGPNSWVWHISPSTFKFMNSTDSFSQNPEINFTDQGKYSVALVASNSLGLDSIIRIDYINILDYCKPKVDSIKTGTGIINVTFEGINNTSGYDSYTDYTQTLSANLEIKGNYKITITRDSGNVNVNRRVWIDFNQDGDFLDLGELAAEDTNSTQLSWSSSFSVPSKASTGTTRMRIGMNQKGYSNTPCGPNRFGEYEDYRLFINPDQTPPVITLKGTNPALTEIGYPYIDSGATAYDAVDGNLTSKITINSTVDTGKIGTYYVKYNVSDVAGNLASEVIRTVKVLDDYTIPVITLKGNDTITVAVFQKYSEPGYTAKDNRDGDITSNVFVSGTVDVNTVGTYTLVYAVYDKSNNTGQAIRTIEVVDTVAPIITLKGSDTVKIALNTTYIDSGTIVTDNYYSGLKAKVTSTVNAFKIGTYSITFTCFDPSKNVAEPKYRTVIVENTIGLNEVYKNGVSLLLYPNPASDYISIRIKLLEKSDIIATIMNSVGEMITTKKIFNSVNPELDFDIRQLPKGIYLLKLESKSGTQVKKFEIE